MKHKNKHKYLMNIDKFSNGRYRNSITPNTSHIGDLLSLKRNSIL